MKFRSFVFVVQVALICFNAFPKTANAEKIYKSHGFSTFKSIQLKYPSTFTHFEYTNPNAPKGGTLRIGARGTFDSLNPYILKGTPASYVHLLSNASLMTQSSHDERHVNYCYVAETLELPESRDWVVFNLRQNVTFNDGTPLTAEDVVFSFNKLKSKGLPMFRSYYKNVKAVEALSNFRVKFTFYPGENLEMPSIIGQMPILSKKYYTDIPFEKTTLAPGISCGPYKIVNVEAGKRIIYERVKDWWGENIPVRKGQYNFDKIEVEYYRDGIVAFEAFKAGEYDYHFDSSAKNWFTGYNFPAAKEKRVIKREIDHEAPTAMGGFFFNTRKEMFKDKRVREAISLAFDFEWANENLFYNSYKRLKSIYTNSGFSADDLPTPEELKILEPFRGKIPNEVFTQVYSAPTTDGSGINRENMRKATKLLKEAGYVIKDNRMVNAKTGEPLDFELIINSSTFLRVTQNFSENLKRIGIKMSVRLLDSAQFELRSENFQYDMIVIFLHTILNPGNEQRSCWGSKAADIHGSSNYAGVKDPVVDQLIAEIINSEDYNELLLYSRALDRIILWNHYTIPLWSPGKYRLAYWNKLSHPKIAPKYSGVGLMTWWYDPEKAKANNLD